METEIVKEISDYISAELGIELESERNKYLLSMAITEADISNYYKSPSNEDESKKRRLFLSEVTGTMRLYLLNKDDFDYCRQYHNIQSKIDRDRNDIIGIFPSEEISDVDRIIYNINLLRLQMPFRRI